MSLDSIRRYCVEIAVCDTILLFTRISFDSAHNLSAVDQWDKICWLPVFCHYIIIDLEPAFMQWNLSLLTNYPSPFSSALAAAFPLSFAAKVIILLIAEVSARNDISKC